MPVWIWSTNPNNNTTADPNINWAEGQSPSSYNDSARQMMAQLAGWRDDNSGLLLTSGSGSAYVLSTNQGMRVPPVSGQFLRFTVHAANAANATIAVDGNPQTVLLVAPGPPAVPIPAGFLVPNCPYDFTFVTGQGWILGNVPNYAASPSVGLALPPIGTIVPFAGAASPSANWLLCWGQTILQSQYPTLYAVVGTAYGGPGVLPDMRGRTFFALDNLGGTAAGRIATNLSTDGGVVNGQQLGSGGGSQSHAQSGSELFAHGHGVGTLGASGTGSGTFGTTASHTHTVTGNVVGPGGTLPGGWVFNATASQVETSSGPSGGESVGVAITTTSTITGTTGAAGGSTAMALLPPMIMVGALIRAL